MAAHFQSKNGQRQCQTNPEPPRHIDKFSVWRRVGCNQFWLQRHAADRARAGADLADFQVHGARVDGTFDHRFGRAGLGFKVFCRII